jgi:hypothetical protein
MSEFIDIYFGWIGSSVVVTLIAGFIAWSTFGRLTQGASGPQTVAQLLLVVGTTAAAVIGISLVGSMFDAPPMVASAVTGLIGGICATSILRPSA